MDLPDQTIKRELPWQLEVFAVSVRKKEKWRWAHNILQGIITPKSSCLDVGSGVGTLSILQEELGGQWTFTETDADSAAETRKIVRGNVMETDIYDDILSVTSYDIITVFDVIEHVPDAEEFFKRLTELLAPGGALLLTTPADDGYPYFLRQLGKKLFGIDQKAHAHIVEGFSEKELRRLAVQAGLAVEHLEQFSFFFTEMVELAYNGTYILKNRRRQTTRGYNVALSPASAADVTRHRRELAIIKIIYPLVRAVSLIDRILPQQRGYEWGLLARKPKTTADSSFDTIQKAPR